MSKQDIEAALQAFLTQEPDKAVEYKLVRARHTCPDGFSVSIQGSKMHYCTPRRNFGPYTHVELGFPSERDTLLLQYAEDPETPMDTVYPRVPIGVVVALILKHS